MAELLADDFEEYGSSGRVFRKSDVLESVGGAVAYSLSEFTCHDIAQGVTLVKYLSETENSTALRSSLWVQSSGNWQLLHHQATVAPNAN